MCKPCTGTKAGREWEHQWPAQALLPHQAPWCKTYIILEAASFPKMILWHCVYLRPGVWSSKSTSSTNTPQPSPGCGPPMDGC
jgi:hypothetical protein